MVKLPDKIIKMNNLEIILRKRRGKYDNKS